jgi:hypothetical protein
MEKVWFKLRHAHYPPPPESNILRGCTGIEAPICLGNVIRNLQTLDNMLNPGSIEPFPSSMRVFPTTMIDFKWEQSKSSSAAVSTRASVPLSGGSSVGGDIRTEFKQSIQNSGEYDRLDTYIVQPTQSYITDCLDEEPLATHIEGKLSWTLFMITGLCVARKGRSSTSASHGTVVRTKAGM